MIRKWFGSGDKPKQVGDPAERARPLTTALRQTIRNTVGKGNVPSMPKNAQKAFELSTDPSTQARDFVAVIESDEALSARVIKIANSVFFQRGNRCETIEESVVIIGNEELRNLLNATALSDLFPSRHPARHQFWVNDIATAITAKLLAPRYAPGKESLLFVGGLMHDIGKLLLLQQTGKRYDNVLFGVRTNGTDYCRAEEETFLFNHCEVGVVLSEAWNFSSELTEILHRHHEPWPREGTVRAALSLPHLIKSADLLAHALGLGHPKGFGTFQERCREQLEQVWRYLELDGDARTALLDDVRRTFDEEQELYLAM